MPSLPGAILFTCNLNRVRSPMAAGLVRRLFGMRVYVDSCGLRRDADYAPDPFAVAAMDEIGVDIANHQAKSFEDLDDASFDVVISLTPEAHHRAMEFGRRRSVDLVYWPTMDPTLVTGARDIVLDAYRGVRDGLEARILDRFPQMRTFGG